MKTEKRIEGALTAALARAGQKGAPPQLAKAMRYAVFPGGARIRPQLCLAVAASCGDDDPKTATAAAIAIELLHCASLVHDDLPCFDDAATRRGKPSVHCAFGEPIAVLAGDAMIVLAFEVLSHRIARAPERAAALLRIVSGSVGMPFGIVAGQAWESEPDAILADYQRAKTGSLFAAATETGAVAAGGDATLWRMLGERLGEAYQVADDIHDVVGSAAAMGKPTGQDASFNRPNAVMYHGLEGAVKHLKQLLHDAVESIPPSPGAATLRKLIESESKRFLPAELAQSAA
ncbi:MAG TPA: polyprenyl synthetase family protein [Kiloniellaceae bacterium]|nr:polyprenyl synthetase family protein [Kiloniellaceae bacterium]HIP77132.1 polyprenyl synthetase family protein [Kiloniellaceae bacterium]